MIKGLEKEKLPLYQENGVTVESVVYKDISGLLVYFENPPVHPIGEKEIKALNNAFDKISKEVIEKGEPYKFLIFHRRNDPYQVGADVKEFEGDVDPEWAEKHTKEGVELNNKIRILSKYLKTISTFTGFNWGGSIEVPIMFNYVIGDSRSTAQFSEVELGIIPGWVGVVNTAIKAGIINAEYMAKTGKRVDAEELYRIGIFDLLVDVRIPSPNRPPKPREKDFSKHEEYEMAMKQYEQDLIKYKKELDDHHKETYKELMPVALEFAISDEVPKLSPEDRLILKSKLKFFYEVRERVNPDNYKGIAGKLKSDVRKELEEKGGLPLAPGAVHAIDLLVEDMLGFSSEEIKESSGYFGMNEALLCNGLMQTDNRKEGIDAVRKGRVAKFKK